MSYKISEDKPSLRKYGVKFTEEQLFKTVAASIKVFGQDLDFSHECKLNIGIGFIGVGVDLSFRVPNYTISRSIKISTDIDLWEIDMSLFAMFSEFKRDVNNYLSPLLKLKENTICVKNDRI